MTHPLSGDNSILDIRGIGVEDSIFSNLIKSNERCRAKKFCKQFRDHIDQALKNAEAQPYNCAHWLFARPMTPQATRAPESPEGWDFRSSALAWTTTERPITDRWSFVSEI